MIDYYKKYMKYKKKYLNYKSKYFIKGGAAPVNTFIFDGPTIEQCLIIKSMILDYWHDNPLTPGGSDRSATFIVTLKAGGTVELKNILNDPKVNTYLTDRNPKGGGNHDIKKQHFFMGLLNPAKPTFGSICCLLGPGWLDHFVSGTLLSPAYNFLNAFDQANATPTTFGKCKPLHSAIYLGDGFAPINYDKLLHSKYGGIMNYIEVLNTALIISFYKRYGFLDNCRKPEEGRLCYHFIWAVANTTTNYIYFYSFCGGDGATHPLIPFIREDGVIDCGVLKTNKSELLQSAPWLPTEEHFEEVGNKFCIKSPNFGDFYFICIPQNETSSCSLISDIFNIYLYQFCNNPLQPEIKETNALVAHITPMNAAIDTYNENIDPSKAVATAPVAGGGGRVANKHKPFLPKSKLKKNSRKLKKKKKNKSTVVAHGPPPQPAASGAILGRSSPPVALAAWGMLWDDGLVIVWHESLGDIRDEPVARYYKNSSDQAKKAAIYGYISDWTIWMTEIYRDYTNTDDTDDEDPAKQDVYDKMQKATHNFNTIKQMIFASGIIIEGSAGQHDQLLPVDSILGLTALQKFKKDIDDEEYVLTLDERQQQLRKFVVEKFTNFNIQFNNYNISNIFLLYLYILSEANEMYLILDIIGTMWLYIVYHLGINENNLDNILYRYGIDYYLKNIFNIVSDFFVLFDENADNIIQVHEFAEMIDKLLVWGARMELKSFLLMNDNNIYNQLRMIDIKSQLSNILDLFSVSDADILFDNINIEFKTFYYSIEKSLKAYTPQKNSLGIHLIYFFTVLSNYENPQVPINSPVNPVLLTNYYKHIIEFLKNNTKYVLTYFYTQLIAAMKSQYPTELAVIQKIEGFEEYFAEMFCNKYVQAINQKYPDDDESKFKSLMLLYTNSKMLVSGDSYNAEDLLHTKRLSDVLKLIKDTPEEWEMDGPILNAIILSTKLYTESFGEPLLTDYYKHIIEFLLTYFYTQLIDILKRNYPGWAAVIQKIEGFEEYFAEMFCNNYVQDINQKYPDDDESKFKSLMLLYTNSKMLVSGDSYNAEDLLHTRNLFVVLQVIKDNTSEQWKMDESTANQIILSTKLYTESLGENRLTDTWSPVVGGAPPAFSSTPPLSQENDAEMIQGDNKVLFSGGAPPAFSSTPPLSQDDDAEIIQGDNQVIFPGGQVGGEFFVGQAFGELRSAFMVSLSTGSIPFNLFVSDDVGQLKTNEMILVGGKNKRAPPSQFFASRTPGLRSDILRDIKALYNVGKSQIAPVDYNQYKIWDKIPILQSPGADVNYRTILLTLYLFDFKHKCEVGPRISYLPDGRTDDFGALISQLVEQIKSCKNYESFHTFLKDYYFSKVDLLFESLKGQTWGNNNNLFFWPGEGDYIGAFLIKYFYEYINVNSRKKGEYISRDDSPFVQILQLYNNMKQSDSQQHAMVTLLEGLYDNFIECGYPQDILDEIFQFKYMLYIKKGQELYTTSKDYNFTIDQISGTGARTSKFSIKETSRELQKSTSDLRSLLIDYWSMWADPADAAAAAAADAASNVNNADKCELMKKLNDVCEKQDDIQNKLVDSGESWNTTINLPNYDTSGTSPILLETYLLGKTELSAEAQRVTRLDPSVATIMSKLIFTTFTPNLQNLPEVLTITYNHNDNETQMTTSARMPFDPAYKELIIRTQFIILFSFSVHLLYMFYQVPPHSPSHPPSYFVDAIQMCIDYLKLTKKKRGPQPQFIELKDLPFEFSMNLLQPHSDNIYMISFKPKTYFLKNKLSMLQWNVDKLQEYEDAVTSDPVWRMLSTENIFKLLGPVIKASNKLLKSQIKPINQADNSRIIIPKSEEDGTPSAYFFTQVGSSKDKVYKLSTISNYWSYLLTFLQGTMPSARTDSNRASPGNFFGGNSGTLYQDIIEIINYHKFSGDQLQRLICLAHGFEHCKFATAKPRNVEISNGLLQTKINPNDPCGSLWFTQDKSTTFGAIIEIAQCLKNFVVAYNARNAEAAENAYIYLQSLPIIVKPICSKHPIGQKSDLEDNPRKLFPCTRTGIQGNKETNKDIKYLPYLPDWNGAFQNLSINIQTGEYAGIYFTGNLAFDFRKLWPDWDPAPAQITTRMSALGEFCIEVLNSELQNLFAK